MITLILVKRIFTSFVKDKMPIFLDGVPPPMEITQRYCSLCLIFCFASSQIHSPLIGDKVDNENLKIDQKAH